MNNAINIKDLSFRYPQSESWALKDINLNVNSGEVILLTGPSACGKTTLFKCLNGLIPHLSGGELKGKIEVSGEDPSKKRVVDMAHSVGMVFQDPENQITQTTVENEIAFGLENRNLPVYEMEERITSVLEKLEISYLRERRIDTLSGGEKQKVVLASTLALKPKILALDEPTSQLDPWAAENFLNLIKSLANKENLTILISEHRIERILEFTDRIFDLGKNSFVGKNIFEEYPIVDDKLVTENVTNLKEIISVRNLNYSYNSSLVLDDVSLKINEGEFIAITGPNGAGKSTLVKHFNCLLNPPSSTIHLHGRDISENCVEDMACEVGFVGQNPNDYLFSESVKEELQFTLDNLKLKGDIIKTLSYLGIADLIDKYPRDLSGGERQRVALASVLVADPKILVFDEPTRGLDWKTKETFIEYLKNQQKLGKTIILVTHDIRLIKHCADRVIHLSGGDIEFDGPISEWKET
ncbi:MAG: ABC transporter ATP-binding protein [Candidatus Altiarchaeota archaeon]